MFIVYFIDVFVEKQFVTSIFTTGGYYLRFGVALDHVIALSKTFVNKMEKNRYTLSKKSQTHYVLQLKM